MDGLCIMPSPIHRAAAQPARHLRAATQLLITALLLCCRLAHGELAPRPPILLLPLETNGARGAALTDSVAQRLLLMGESVQQASVRAPCQSRDCLSRIAEQHRVTWLLGGSVTMSGGACTVQLWLFDLNLAVATPSEARQRDGCDPAALDDLLTATAGALVEQHIPEVELPPPPAQSVATPSPPLTTRATKLPLLSRPRLIGVAILGSLLGLTLTGSIALNVLDLRLAPADLCAGFYGNSACYVNARPYYTAGYALSEALVLGLTLTFILPTKGKNRR